MRYGFAVARLVLRRALANMRLLATVILGVLLACALLASVAIYSDAIRDLGLTYALRQEPDQSLDFRILSSSQSADPALYAPRKETIDELVDRQAGDVLSAVVHYGRSDTFFPSEVGSLPNYDDPDRARAHFQFSDDLADHVDVVDGEPFGPEASPGEESLALTAWIGADAAEALGIAVGDTFDLHPFWRQDLRPVTVTIAGLLEPKNPDDRYWYEIQDRFLVEDTTWPTWPLWIDEETLIGPMASYLPSIDGTFETYGIVDREAVNSRNAENVQLRVQSLGTQLSRDVERTGLATTLPAAIDTYQEKLFFTRLPLFALMIQVAGIVLYYLVMVSTMIVDRQVGEIALLRSRGASVFQVMGIYAIEGGLICLLGIILGPLLAGGAIALLGYTPSFNELSGGEALEITIGRWAYALAALGAVLSLLALLVPAFFASSKSMVDYKQGLARPPRQPAFFRYYMDLGVVGVAAYAFYQLQQRGSLVTERLFGDLAADPLLLAAPTLFMVTVALVFLRVFPRVLAIVAWIGKRFPGVTLTLGLWHIVRTPSQYSRLILLLLLATAVGMFAAGFRATLERSYDDRAAYEAGADARLAGMSTRDGFGPELFARRVAETTDAETVSPAARVSGSYQASQFSFTSVDVLGIDPATFPSVAFWRGDFAGPSLESLVERLPVEAAEDPAAITLPAETAWLGLWLLPPAQQLPLDLQVGVRVLDADGAFWEYRLRPTGLSNGDWILLGADLARPFPPRDGRMPDTAAGVVLDSLFVRVAGVAGLPIEITMSFDDLMSFSVPPGEDGAFPGEPVLVESFEDISRYVEITGSTRDDVPTFISRAAATRPAAPDDYAARLDFTYASGTGNVFGLRIARPGDILPVIANNGFMDDADLSVGDEARLFLNRQYVTVRIVGAFEYFPTWDPASGEHFMVADLYAMRDLAARLPFMAEAVTPNEAWLAGVDPAKFTRDALQSGGLSAQLVDVRDTLRAEAAADPLVAASWEGILFLSFAAVLTLTALGFVVYSYLSARARSLEFAILRTMGFTPRQVLGLVAFEQLFVILAGVIVGTFLGFPLGRLMIGYLGITERGADVLPPLVSEVSWAAVLTVYALLALAFVGTVAALGYLYSRLALHRALRMGEL